MNPARLLALSTIVALASGCIYSLAAQDTFTGNEASTMVLAGVVIGVLFGAEWVA